MNRDLILAACAAFVLMTAGCSMFQSKAPAPLADDAQMCSVWSPIVPAMEDALTDATASQILTHNCVGYRLGCWSNPGMREACEF